MYKLPLAALDWALEHIETYGDTDLLPVPFEFAGIRNSWPTIREDLSKKDLTQYSPSSLRRVLAPKGRFAFRSVTQLDPLDSLIFAALLYEAGTSIEAVRVPVAEQTAMSHRVKPDTNGRLFDPEFDWRRFQRRANTLIASSEFTHVVTADIADFFPRIYLHPLENALDECLHNNTLAASIKRFLQRINQSVSYGILSLYQFPGLFVMLRSAATTRTFRG